MPTRRIEAVALPYAGKRYTPDTSRLALLYAQLGRDLADNSMAKGQISQRGFEQLGSMFSGFAQTNRATAAAKTAASARVAERADERAFTKTENDAERAARIAERQTDATTRANERKTEAEARKLEKDEASVSDAIDKAPRGIANPVLVHAAAQFPNQAARFVVQDGVAVLPMTGPERQAYDREKGAAADRKADNDRLQLQFEELKRENLAKDAARTAAATDKTDLSPAGLEMAALNYRKTGVMPALGNGDKVTRKFIINRAAELTPTDMARIESSADIAANKQNYTANSASLNALQKSRDAIGAFEQTAQKNIDVFLDVAGKVVDTGSPLANRLAREVSGTMLGSPDQAAYDAARQVATNEIAKITSNPTLAGQLSDSARHEVDAFNPREATLAQSVRVMRLLKTEMQNRTKALDSELDAVRARGKTQVPPVADGRVYYDADGNPIKKP